jgi:NAD(P)-dependent dehydrogenase (short-subunit alcohol dehydrogenase family)
VSPQQRPDAIPAQPSVRSNRMGSKVAIVTGTAGGIGKGVALMLARAGAKVIGCDIRAEPAAATVAEARAEGLEFDSAHPVDLTKPDGIRPVIDLALRRHGGLDVLVNAAAFGVFDFIPDMDFETGWRRTLAGELDLVFLAVKAIWPHLIARGGGSIVNFASANAYVALPGHGAIAHCAGKGGVLAMTRQIAMEGGPYNIRCNSISPALVLTDATRPEIAAHPDFAASALSKMMVRRFGEVEDIGHFAIYLTSDEATWVTGADMQINGGATAW